MIRLTSFLSVWFQCVCPLMPSCNTYHLTWVSFTLGVGYLFMAAPAKHSRCSLPWRGYLLTAAIPDLQRGIAPLSPPGPAQPPLLRMLLPAAGPGLRLGMAPRVRGGFSRPPRPSEQDSSSRQLPLTSDAGCFLLAATDLGHGVSPPGRH